MLTGKRTGRPNNTHQILMAHKVCMHKIFGNLDKIIAYVERRLVVEQSKADQRPDGTHRLEFEQWLAFIDHSFR